MSFSSTVKNEMCRATRRKECCRIAECYGIIAFCHTFTTKEVRIVTENAAFAKRARELFLIVFRCDADIAFRSGRYTLLYTDTECLRRIFSVLGYDYDHLITFHFNGWIVEQECCLASFLRGAFLAGGIAVDPGKSYLLELTTPRITLARELTVPLSEMSLHPKLIKRQQNWVIYFKESENIEDFLTITGAPASAMRIMEEKVVKSYRNKVNRQSNCEVANIKKSVNAVQTQIEAIRALDKTVGIDNLPEQLRQTARLRLSYPEDNLVSLAQRTSPQLSKSGINHRLKKLMEMSEDIDSKQKDRGR